MFSFLKKLFGSKPVEAPVAAPAAVPYKVEAPAQESTPVVAEPRKEVTTEASKPAVITTAGNKKRNSPKKPGAPKKPGNSKPRKPKAPKTPKA